MRTFAPQSRWLALVMVALLAASLSQTPQPSRPKITGFSHVAIYVTDLDKARAFYGGTLGYAMVSRTQFRVNDTQSIEIELGPKELEDRIAHIAFLTDSAQGMLDYLKSKGVSVPDKVNDGRYGSHWFALKDPAGQPIEFVEENAASASKSMVQAAFPPPSKQIIHVGFLVRDRAAEEHFYKDILGFRGYWHGGMKPDRTDWVALQVPDGTVWIEEMVGPSERPDAHELGVLNHFSLGVDKIETVIPKLQQHGWKPTGDDQKKPQMGLDGKWQFNIYDPDLTRVEYMEFVPARKPCCSEFAGPHPHD